MSITASMYNVPWYWDEDKKYLAHELVIERVGGEIFTYRSLHGNSRLTPNKGYRPSMNPLSWELMVPEEVYYKFDPYVLGGKPPLL